VAAGESIFTRDELRRMTAALATPRLTADVEVPLTQREGEVLREMAKGSTNKQIAEALHVGYETIKEHLQHIFRKIGVDDRTQAAVWAIRKGLVLRTGQRSPPTLATERRGGRSLPALTTAGQLPRRGSLSRR
jgi:DNA-binding NarL/FixJ family response regulator